MTVLIALTGRKLLHLSKKTKIAQGTARTVHLVKGEKNLLVKIEIPKKVKKNRYFKRFQNYLFPTNYRFIRRETNEDIRIQIKAEILGIKSPIAATRGLIQTSQGLGQLVERIGPDIKGLGPSLLTMAVENKLNEKRLKELNEFATAMFDTGVVANDLQPINIIWSEATNSFFLVDGFGERNFIQLKTYIKFIRNRKMNNWFLRLARKIDLTWSTKNRKFNF